MNTILVAEIGLNSSGSIPLTKRLIDLAIEGGCKYVKFQKRDINLVYTKEELDRYRESPWGTTNRQQKEGLEFNIGQYKEIDTYCKEKKIGWLASPWDVNSVDFLMQFDLPFIKIASASLLNIPLLQKIKDTKKPVILSTGMSTLEEIGKSVSFFEDQIQYILYCKSSYPTPDEEQNISGIKTLQKIYGDRYRIGFSNHSSGILYMLAAECLGAEMIEYHITLDRTMYGTDQASSLESSGVLDLRGGIEKLEKGWGNGEIKCEKSEVCIKEKLRKIL